MARFTYISAAMLVLAIGCAGKLEDAAKFKEAGLRGGGCSLNIDVEKAIFVEKCGACHGSTPQLNHLDLGSPDVFKRLVGVASTCGGRPLVESKAPASGVLIDKLTTAPPCGARMPFSMPPLSDAEIDCVAAWIDTKLGGTP